MHPTILFLYFLLYCILLYLLFLLYLVIVFLAGKRVLNFARLLIVKLKWVDNINMVSFTLLLLKIIYE